MDKFLAGLDSHNQAFSLFGGEPLLLKLDQLETIFQHGFEKWGSNGVQTNGTLITSAHMDMFRKYRVHVGFSIDGPWPVNSTRCNEILTRKSMIALNNCLEEKIDCSLIFTITQETVRYQNVFTEWLRDLDYKGLKNARIHLLEHDNNIARPDRKDLLELLLTLEREELKYRNLQFDLFNEIVTLLQNPFADVTCVWNKCDPYTTSAVQGVGPSGERYNCGRTNKEGIQWSKSRESGHERQVSLYHTDCMGCKFFLACKGYCPGTAIDGDWRRKTEHCETIYALFEEFETRLINNRIKVFTRASNRKEIEENFIYKMDAEMTRGCNEKGHNEKGLVERGTMPGDTNNHTDWHIDGDKRTGIIPVLRS
jgi:uncharacterized protein